MRTALFIAATLIAGTPALAEPNPNFLKFDQYPTQQGQARHIRTNSDGARFYLQTAPGGIYFCRYVPDSTLIITVSGQTFTMEGGRMCTKEETPELIFDPSRCSVNGGENTGSIAMNCSGRGR